MRKISTTIEKDRKHQVSNGAAGCVPEEEEWRCIALARTLHEQAAEERAFFANTLRFSSKQVTEDMLARRNKTSLRKKASILQRLNVLAGFTAPMTPARAISGLEERDDRLYLRNIEEALTKESIWGPSGSWETAGVRTNFRNGPSDPPHS